MFVALLATLQWQAPEVRPRVEMGLSCMICVCERKPLTFCSAYPFPFIHVRQDGLETMAAWARSCAVFKTPNLGSK